MLRGDIYWHTFKPPDKRRPILIVTRASVISVLRSVTVAPLTTTVRDIPVEVFLTPDEDGTLQECVVNCDNLATVPKVTLGKRITSLSYERMLEVDAALMFALGVDRLS